jgi:hypothetical protein
VLTFTKSQLHHEIQYFHVSILVILILSLSGARGIAISVAELGIA